MNVTYVTYHRYVTPGGGAAISVSRVPGDKMEAGVRTEVRECLGEDRVRYHHISLVTRNQVQDQEQGVKQRRGRPEPGDQEEKGKITPVRCKDPIKWFGVLSPPSLKQSQV